MISFVNDYCEGACDEILQALIRTNMEKLPGYGTDPYSASAEEKIKAACETPEGQVFFLAGGTQANQIVIDCVLNPYEGVVAAASGHIAVHEAGAVEFTGRKVLTVPGHDGKMKACELRAFVKAFYDDESHEHMVFPGMAYISQPTELGTLYSGKELEEIYSVCREYGMSLFIDGARLGYGLVAPECDMTLPELAALCDVFYIGGTKVGALCGEAVVFTHGNAPKYFSTLIKKHGAMPAKGRLFGIQFDTLFTDGLYFRLAENAMRMIKPVKEALREKGYEFFVDSPTNQQFVIVGREKFEELSKKVAFTVWEKLDEERTVIRIVTSWASKEEDVRELIAAL